MVDTICQDGASNASTTVKRDALVAQWKQRVPMMLLAALIFVMTAPGIAYRHWVWDYTSSVRYRFDMERNYSFGVGAMEVGFLNLYENQLRDNPSRDKKLDYPPLRLLTFEAWAAWMRWSNPEARRWLPDYAFNAFLMRYNTLLEWLGSLAACLIVRHWLRRCASGPRLEDGPAISPWTGMWQAAAAFGLLWFDPGMAIVGHGWASPNIWIVPFYLWAVLLCLWDWWFVGGVILGIGAMLQGQQLSVAGMFVLWPLFALQPMRALRWVSGFALAFMAAAAGWMLSVRPDISVAARQVNWPAVVWVSLSVGLLALVGLRLVLRQRVRREVLWLLAGAAGMTLAWPALRSGNAGLIVVAAAVAGVWVWLFWRVPWTIRRYLLALTAGGCLLLCIPFYGAGTAWWEIGFVYGTERFVGLGNRTTNNLCAILRFNFDWRWVRQTAFSVPPELLWGWPASPLPVSIRQLLLGLFAVFLAAGSAALARHWRRGDRSLLVAVVLPWVLFYTLLPQMMPRYAVFIAGVGAICIGRSVGMALLVLFFSLLTVEQAAVNMMENSASVSGWSSAHPLFNRQMFKSLYQLNPDLSWAVLVAAGVFLWAGLTGAKGRQLRMEDRG